MSTISLWLSNCSWSWLILACRVSCLNSGYSSMWRNYCGSILICFSNKNQFYSHQCKSHHKKFFFNYSNLNNPSCVHSDLSCEKKILSEILEIYRKWKPNFLAKHLKCDKIALCTCLLNDKIPATFHLLNYAQSK